MTDVATITAGFQSLKAAFDIGKALLNLGISADIQDRIREMNDRILTAQESAIASRDYQSALLKQVGDLEKQIAELEAWNADADTYQLKDVAGHGRRAVYAYAPKEGTHTAEPFHLICAKCFQEEHKSILQGTDTPDQDQYLECPRCKTVIFAAHRFFQ